MRSTTLIAVPAAVLALATGRVSADTGTAPSTATMVDRTFACSTVLLAGIRQVRLGASSAVAGQKDHFGQQAQPFLQLTTGGTLIDSSLAGMSAGPSTRRWRATLWVGNDRCRSSARRVALTPAGLRGGPASPFGDEIECESSPIVFVRIRGVFGTPTRLRQAQSGLLTTNATLREGSLAVETLKGKRLIYADVRAPTKARLFAAKGCFPG